MKQIICFLLIALAASKSIPEFYSQNQGILTSDYTVVYSSPKSSNEFGTFSEAGDINNDGIADFIVADPAYDGNRGIVYVIYGKSGSLRQMLSLTEFDAKDGFILKGTTPGQMLGFSVGSAGDVNGDGIDDIIVSSFKWSQTGMGNEVGLVYVIFGCNGSKFPSILDLNNLSLNQGFKIYGEASGNLAGYSVSGAGDMNGDGIPDLMLSAIFAGNGGKVYVIYGGKNGFKDIRLPPGAGQGFTIDGSNQEHFGNSVSKVGDFNGDGVDDIIVGAHCADSWRGRAYVIYGRRQGFPSVIRTPQNSNEGMVLYGSSSGDNFGCTVSGAGDFNGDGLQDVVVGAYAANGGKGGSYVILGSRQNPLSMFMNSLDRSRAFDMSSSGVSNLGLFVAGGRDLNGDGKSDVVISAPGMNNHKGGVYVIYGYQSNTFTNLWLDNALKPHQGYFLSGAKEGDRFGTFARPLKDVNNDKVNDLIVGSFGANNGKGAAYLFYTAWKCLDKCSQCSRPDTCDACAPGFGFFNGDCTVCPSATHMLSNGFCITKCFENCGRCTTPFVCDFCAPGFGFLQGKCTVCPAETHVLASNGSCKVKCSENCEQCSQPNTCEVCAEGFGFFHGQCAACPANTHFLSNGVCKENVPLDPYRQFKDLFESLFH